MLRFYQSNALESLAAFFAQFIKAVPLQDPFAKEIVVVPSLAIKHYLNLALVKHNGIAANLDMMLPEQWVQYLITQAANCHFSHYGFTHEAMAWRLFALLPNIAPLPEFATWQSHVVKSQLSRFYLAHEIASLFEQYLIYRLDWLTAWENQRLLALGEDELWQAKLWQQLAQGISQPHHIQHYLQSLDSKPIQALPERITLFGVMHLAKTYLALFKSLGDWIEVYGFVLNPCGEYWGETKASHVSILLDSTHGKESAGDILLNQLGHKGRAFLHALSLDEAWHVKDLFLPPATDKLLGQLQHSLLVPSYPLSQYAALPRDASIALHVAHSPLRELEILKNQLLRYFAEDKTLTPSDIAILAPDINVYQPFIDAVFATSPGEMPYRITRPANLFSSQPLLQAFMMLIDLMDSRFIAQDVCQLLDSDALSRRFGFSSQAVKQIKRWVRLAGISWGRDAAHRGACGFPKDPTGSWRFGLNQLLLGALLPPALCTEDAFRSFATAPIYSSWKHIRTLTKLGYFFDACHQLSINWQVATDAKGWVLRLQEVLGSFFEPSECDEAALDRIQLVLSQLLDSHQFNPAQTFELPVLRAWLHEAICSLPQYDTFSDTLTFGTLHGYCGVPFKILCLIGLDGNSFPSKTKAMYGNLMAHHLRSNDCTVRDDEAYVWLMALLSAREKLYLSWVGHTQDSDDVLPPAVWVNQLQSLFNQFPTYQSGNLATAYASSEPSDILPTFLPLSHPLQPFSRDYYHAKLDALVNFDAIYAAGLAAKDHTFLPFAAVLPYQRPAISLVPWDDFVQFWQDPAQYWLSEQLEIKPIAYQYTPLVREHLTLNASRRHQLQRYVLESQYDHKSDQSDGSLSQTITQQLGVLGQIYWQEANHRVHLMMLPSGMNQSPLPTMRFEIACQEGKCLVGNLENIRSSGYFCFAQDRFLRPAIIQIWLQHLVLNIVAAGRFLPISTLIDSDGYRVLPALDKILAIHYLNAWVAWYHIGKTMPLPFFCKTSWKTALTMAKAGTQFLPQDILQKAPVSNDHLSRQNDLEKAPVRLAFRQRDPLSDVMFLQTITSLLMPLAKYYGNSST